MDFFAVWYGGVDRDFRPRRCLATFPIVALILQGGVLSKNGPKRIYF